jgi:hypothetical protein
MNRKGPAKGPHRRAPKDSPYAGRTTCLRCDREFQSWDRRQNRLCAHCRDAIAEGASEEPSYQLTRPRPRTHDDG